MAAFKERHVIVSQPKKRPYGSKVVFALGEGRRIRVDGKASLLLNDEHIIGLEPISTEHIDNSQRFRMRIEGFATAGEAELAGMRLSSALLWLAISMNYPLRLEYHTPLPSMVYNRSDGKTLIGELSHLTVISRLDAVVEVLKQVYSGKAPFGDKLLVSMELFASARMELTERAKFLGLVSALEPIAEQRDCGQAIEKLTEQFLTQLGEAQGISDELRRSLAGRIRDLRRESVSRSICRLIQSQLSDSKAVETIKEAYNVRSKIIHEGSSQADLDELGCRVEGVIRRLYSKLTQLELKVPSVVS